MTRILIFLLLITGIGAQAQADSLQQQINRQVWRNFVNAYNSYNTDAFMAVHSKDLARVLRDGEVIVGFDAYRKNIEQSNRENKRANRKQELQLRFTQRIATADRAFETGYFKVEFSEADGRTSSFYGRFHVLLKKEKNVWKITMDADANENTTEEIFLKGKTW